VLARRRDPTDWQESLTNRVRAPENPSLNPPRWSVGAGVGYTASAADTQLVADEHCECGARERKSEAEEDGAEHRQRIVIGGAEHMTGWILTVLSGSSVATR